MTVSSLGSASSFAVMRQQLFQKTDADSSGSLSLEEFKAGAPQGAEGASATKASSTAPSLEDIFSQMDTDGDGSVTQAEFDSFKPPKPDGSTASLLSMSGESGSALIELLSQLLEEVSASSGAAAGQPPSAAEMFAQTDTDGNGSLSLDEFKAGAPEGADTADSASGASSLDDLFAEMDQDGDGEVTSDEFAAAAPPPPMGGPPPMMMSSSDDDDEDDTTTSSATTAQTLQDQLAELAKLIEQYQANYAGNYGTNATSTLLNGLSA